MPINLRYFVCLVGLLIIQSDLKSQTLTTQEYQVINDIFGAKSSRYKFPLCYKVESNSVFDLIVDEDAESTNFIATGLDDSEYRVILKDFYFDQNRLDSLDQYQFNYEKKKLDKDIKVKKSKKNCLLLSRPIISGDFAFIYLKTPGKSFSEKYIIAKKIMGVWIVYGEVLLEEVFVDELVN